MSILAMNTANAPLAHRRARRIAVATAMVLAVSLWGTRTIAGQRIVPHGDPTWVLTENRGSIKGFSDRYSVADGDSFRLFVTTPAATYDAIVYRLGWYDNGANAATRMAEQHGIPGIRQPGLTVDPATGMSSAANWTSNASFTVSGWKTGLYLIKLIAADGDDNYIPIVVRDDTHHHDFLFEHATNTDLAYNDWGGNGKNLYTDANGDPAQRAYKATLDRPFRWGGEGISALHWELDLIRYLERNNLDVAYTTDIDVHANANFAANAGALLVAGHSEYWSKEMRDHMEAAQAQGKGIGIFSGDTGAWAVRFEDSPLGKNRIMVCYRDATLDPLRTTDPAHVTVEWYTPPLNRPLQNFMGVATNATLEGSADWTVEGIGVDPLLTRLYDGTGFRNGDAVRNLIAFEYDGMGTPGSDTAVYPAGLRVAGRARLTPDRPLRAVLKYAVRNDLDPSTAPAPGTLSTSVETVAPDMPWYLSVELATAPGPDRQIIYLQYRSGDGSPKVFTDGATRTAVFPLGAAVSATGWHPLTRDLVQDAVAAFGTLPAGLKVAALVPQGSLSLAPLTITAPGGTAATFTYSGSPRADGWYVQSGVGALTVGTLNGNNTLMLRADLGSPREDESQTVVVQTPGKGPLFAAGSMNWVYALDDYATTIPPYPHQDALGNATPVDARLQIFTRNLLGFLLNPGVPVPVPTPTPTPPTAPAVPTNLQIAGPPADTSIPLSWTDNAKNEDAYQIASLRTAPSAAWQYQPAGANATTATLAGLLPGNEYLTYLRACNGAGCSDWSNTVKGTTSGPPPPTPAGFTVASATFTGITLTWGAAAAVAATVQAGYIQAGGGALTWVTLPAPATSYTIANVVPGATYYAYLRACNAIGCSAYAGPLTTTAGGLPATPGSFRLTAAGSAAISVAWDGVAGATSYQVDYTTAGSSGYTTRTLTPDTTSFTLQQPESPQTYYLYVRACNAGGCSAWSAPLTAATGAVPLTPANFRHGTTVGSSPQVLWDDVSGESSYQVAYVLSSDTHFTYVSLPADTTSYTAQDLTPGALYYFYVRACNAAGCSAYTSGLTVQAGNEPPTPDNFRIEATSTIASQVAWDDGPMETRYEVAYARAGIVGLTVLTATADSTMMTITGLVPGGVYYVYLRACNAAGCSAYTPPLTIQTLGASAAPVAAGARLPAAVPPPGAGGRPIPPPPADASAPAAAPAAPPAPPADAAAPIAGPPLPNAPAPAAPTTVPRPPDDAPLPLRSSAGGRRGGQ